MIVNYSVDISMIQKVVLSSFLDIIIF